MRGEQSCFKCFRGTVDKVHSTTTIWRYPGGSGFDETQIEHYFYHMRYVIVCVCVYVCVCVCLLSDLFIYFLILFRYFIKLFDYN